MIVETDILGAGSGLIVKQDYNKVVAFIKLTTQQPCQLLIIGNAWKYKGNSIAKPTYPFHLSWLAALEFVHSFAKQIIHSACSQTHII